MRKGGGFMSKFVFISDFDGTLTKKDFYQMIIDDYLGEMGTALYEAWRRKEYKDRDFLNKIYSSVNMEEEALIDYILSIEWDHSANEVIKKIKAAGGEFVILSAGTSYYIQHILKKQELTDIKVYSNPGIYKDKGLHLEIDEGSAYFSDIYGIDKAKVVQELKRQYDTIYYAGDSAPDIPACKLADVAFAKGGLQEMLEEEGVDFVPIKSYKDIQAYLMEKGVIE